MPNESEKYYPEASSDVTLVASDTKLERGLVTSGARPLACAVADRCGGCPEFRRAPLEQRAVKGKHLRAGLAARGVGWSGELGWLWGATDGYRNRIRLALVGGAPSYFNREKDPHCVVLEPGLVTALRAFEQWAVSHRAALAAYCVAEVRTFDADGRAAVYLRHTQRNGVSAPAPDWTALPDDFGAGPIAVEGGPLRFQRFAITADVHARIPVGGFMQVNATANRAMVTRVCDWARALGARSVYDLFAGSGNLSLPLARAGCRVRAVESDAAACRGFELSAADQQLTDAMIICGDALFDADARAVRGERFDLVIADPPRGGLRGRVGAVVALAARGVVLVGCDAERFCVDARAMCDAGYRLTECVAVDMFPHTSHLEVLGLFEPVAPVAAQVIGSVGLG